MATERPMRTRSPQRSAIPAAPGRLAGTRNPMTTDLEPVDLPAVIDRAQAAWREIEASALGDRMKRALRRVAGGQGVRESAELEGYSDSRDLYRYCKRFKLIDARTKAIVDTHRHVAKLAGLELEDRLLRDSKKISASQLAMIGGVSTDKVFASEKANIDDGSSYISALEKMAERFGEGGATLELKVTIGSTRPGADTIDAHEVIDVTPRENQ